MADNKMYEIGRPVTLPENMQLSKSMFQMKSHLNLPTNMKGTYYLNEFPVLGSNELKEDESTVFSKIGMISESTVREMSLEGLQHRQQTILKKLKKIKEKLSNLKGSQMVFLNGGVQISSDIDSLKSGVIHDMVVSANPSSPPYFLLPVKKALASQFRILSSSSVHSSVSHVDPSLLKLFSDEAPKERSSYDIAFTVLWKDQSTKSLMVKPLSQSLVLGEANILRYISRLFPAISSFSYESQASFNIVSETDHWLDAIENKLLHGNNKEQQAVFKQVNSKLGTCEWIAGGSSSSLCDMFCWSVILERGLREGLPTNVAAWFRRMQAVFPMPTGSELGTVRSDNMRSLVDRKGLEGFLKRNGIEFQSRNHDQVFTAAALVACVGDMPGVHTKNLFLKDKKKNLYLLSTRHDAQINLSDVGNQLGARELRFPHEDTLFETLGVRQGCVTLYALLNDAQHKVTLLLDSQALNTDHAYVNFHPMSNDATLGVSPQDLKKFLKLTGHKVHLMDF